MRRFLVVFLTVGSMACAKKAQEPDNHAALAAQRAAELESKRQTLEENFSRIHYHFDSDMLTDDSKDLLRANAEIMMQYPELAVEVEGHCDERGTTEYNLALGQRRADAVLAYLKDMGVTASSVQTVSYGEEKPFAQGHDETAWSQNRRAHFRFQ